MSRQKPADVSICCQVLPVWRTVKDKSNENSITSPAQRRCTGRGGGAKGGVLTRGGSLVEEEVQGRYGCRPNSICTSLRLVVEMRSGRQENLPPPHPHLLLLLLLLLNKSHVIYNNSPPGNVQKEPRKKTKKKPTRL